MRFPSSCISRAKHVDNQSLLDDTGIVSCFPRAVNSAPQFFPAICEGARKGLSFRAKFVKISSE
jgi:hypothetical protein